MKKKRVVTIAVVEDSRPYLSLLSMFVKQLAKSINAEVELFLFDNPVDYKIDRKEYDIVVLDYVFRQYTYGANGFYLAKLTKERTPATYVVINSSYDKSEIGELLKEFSEYIDSYSHKEVDMFEEGEGLLMVLMHAIERIYKEK